MPRTLCAAWPLILGSASPRRREILASLGIPCSIEPAAVDEGTLSGENPEQYLERVVERKRAAVVGRAAADEPRALLVADTSVTLDGEILGKPADEADAERLLSALCGREHRVLTRYALGLTDGAVFVARTVATRVWMRAASRAEIRGYARTGEGLDKAGAYAVQGHGAFLVERIDGSYTNVVGLPACELVLDLTASGLIGPYP
nr:dTTP/UTP pyrophosphatase [uncultured bacterium]